ncbi:hypothetical protein GGI23_000067 [Coemansia sp. RSA 2559]|nr:hypothetical protein GGI23_000067 [Coemansia sp. RSA 2559]KAJ2869692.1 hypothetical protein GGI22_000092 [Coemansia erecta]
MSLFLDVRADIASIFNPAKVPGSSVYIASNGTDLGMQAIFAGTFFLVFIVVFSALRLRWPFIFSPRTRLTLTAPPLLPRKFFGWVLPTLRTSETHVLNTLGLDAVIFLRFYKMSMRLLLDISLLSIAIIWPISIRWSKANLSASAAATAAANASNDGDIALPMSYSATDYLFNLTLNAGDAKQKWNLVAHIVFAYVFSGIAYYHVTKFSSRWASLRWHFLMQSRHATVSRTVMLTGVPRHLAASARELEWFWGEGVGLGKVERVRVCPVNTRLTGSARERARCLGKLEHAYARLLGNPCKHPDYDPDRLRLLALDPDARDEERALLDRWAAGSSRPTAWVWQAPMTWRRVDAIDHWRDKLLEADRGLRRLRQTVQHSDATAAHGPSTTAFVTFEDATTAHMATQLSCYPNPGHMKARLAPEPRGVYWPNVWHSRRRKWLGFGAKWTCIVVVWAFWSVPVILMSSLLTPASLGRVFPSLADSQRHGLLRSFLSATVPSVFLLLFLNTLPWLLKQVHFATGERTKPAIDYSVLTKMWAFLVFNIVLVFGFSGTFWTMLLNVVNRPGTPMQSLAANIPRVGTFFAGYILVLGVGYQPFKLLQLRPVVWHIARRWLCSTPRDYARLVAPVYIDWYSVYPYPLLVFTIAMVYSSFSPPVVLGAVVYYAIGYPVMKYLLLYVYFRPFESAGMAWPKVCRRMILSVILYQVVMLAFVVVKGGGWYTFSMVPLILTYLWFFYNVGWSLEKQGTVLPVYLWRNPPPQSSYPMPPPSQPSFSADLVDKDASRTQRPSVRSRSAANNTARLILGPRLSKRRCNQVASSANIRCSSRALAAEERKKRLRYKCLAEAATVQGSKKLIKSLSWIPTAATGKRWADSGFIDERAANNDEEGDDDEEWEDDNNVEVDDASWDPLLYLRPMQIGSKRRLQSPPLLLSGIMRSSHSREARASAFASGVVNTPRAESARPTNATAVSSSSSSPTPSPASTPPQRIASRLHGALYRVRDYFLADFRPACPILDLTYDRAYSQTTDAEPTVSATLTPFRQLIGRVLPRSFSPDARATSSLRQRLSPDVLSMVPTRLVTHLNYTPASRSMPPPPFASGGNRRRRISTTSNEESEAEQLLLANYQRYAVEAQSTFAPDQYTDYTQTPMLNFNGILDRGIQDYVHPGLVGELPTLWLPVKYNDTTPQQDQALQSSTSAALFARRWRFGTRIFGQYVDGSSRSSRYSQELHEVHVHGSRSNPPIDDVELGKGGQ